MAGHIIITDLPRKTALELARDVARDLEFKVGEIEDSAFSAGKGNFAVSILLGAIIAYCDFTVEVDRGKNKDESEIVINRNNPWWTGMIGISRVKKRAKELAEAIADAIEEDGGRVFKLRDL